MKKFKRIAVLFVCLALLVSSTMAVGGVGVVYLYSLIPETAHMINEADVAALNEWLKAYPSDNCVIDLFVPGFSMKYLRNSEDSDTVDFDITPLAAPNSSVVVSDIPEIFDGVYEKFVSNIKSDEEGKCSIDVSNIVRQGNSIILDCNAVAYICYFDGATMCSDHRANLYAVTVDKESGEIVRYDFIHDLLPDGWDDEEAFSPSNSEYFDFEKDRVEIAFPAGIDTDKYSYALCVLVYPDYVFDGLYYGEVYLSAMTDVAVLSEDSVYGDANEDGALNLADATEILKYIAKWDGIELNRNLCDVDGDLSVGMTDISRILRLIAGWANI